MVLRGSPIGTAVSAALLPDLVTRSSTSASLGLALPHADHSMRPNWNVPDFVLGKQSLINYVWGGHFPSTGYDTVTPNFQLTGGETPPTGLASMDRWEWSTLGGRGGGGYAYWMLPTTEETGKVMIFHCGHWGNFTNSPYLARISQLLAAGYCVLVCEMPVCGHQPNPLVVSVGFSTMSFNTSSGSPHSFSAMDSASDLGLHSPSTRLFLDPIVCGINQIRQARPTYPIYMMGLSGGAWTAEFVSAVDPRVVGSYRIFGSMPWEILWLSSAYANSVDWEQNSTNMIYRNGGDHMLRYGLGGTGGRRAVNIVSDGDPEFPTTGLHSQIATFSASVASLAGVGNGFSFRYDTTAMSHTITDDTMNFILGDIS